MTVSVPPTTPRRRQNDEAAAVAQRTRGTSRAVALVAAAVASLVTFAVLATDVLPDLVVLPAALTLVLAVPTDPLLRRRVVLNISIALGWAIVPWWVPWPVALDHAAVELAIVSGFLAWRAIGAGPAGGWGGLVPRVTPADATLAVAGFGTLLLVHRWAFVTTPQRALEVLLPGYDNFPHFGMFSMLREHGSTLDVLGRAPDGSGWAFRTYPQGFHAVAATISELTDPQRLSGPEALAVYAHSVSVVVVLGSLLVTAIVLCLPGVAYRPLVLAPALALVWTAFLWQSGQTLVADGFTSFWLSCVAAAAALLIALASVRRFAAVEFAAVGGLLVLVAYTWTPLLLLAGPAVLAMLAPARGRPRSRPAPRRQQWWSWVLLVLAGLAIARISLVLFATVGVTVLVTAVGGFHPPRPVGVAVVVFASLVVPVVFRPLMGRVDPAGTVADLVLRARILALTPLLGLVSLALLLAAQIRAGEGAYYFIKYLTGIELVTAALTVGLLAVVAARVGTPRRPRLAVALSVLLVLGASQLFGAFPAGSAPMLASRDNGTTVVDTPFTRAGIASGILSAAQGEPSPRREYLPIGAGQASQVGYPDGWYHAVNGSLTDASMTRVSRLIMHAHSVRGATAVARRLLRDPDVQVVVDPRYVAPVRAGLGDGAGADRLVGWDRSR